MDVSNKPLPEPMDGLWAFDSRAGGCEVGRLEQGWAPGLQLFGRVL